MRFKADQPISMPDLEWKLLLVVHLGIYASIAMRGIFDEYELFEVPG